MYRRSLTKDQATQKLRHYCGYQERCQSEVRSKLFELKINQNLHDEIIDELVEQNYLDESRFAIAFAVGRFRLKGWGRRKISFALKEKKLSADIIQNALKQINDDEYFGTLEKLGKEKYAALKDEHSPVRLRKTMDYLMHKGYEGDLVYRTADLLREKI